VRCILAIISAISLVACSTPYQEIGFAGGVSAFPMTADVYRIEARGNGYTKRTKMQDFTMLKAAETARAAGASHFMMISAADASSTGTIVTPGQAQTTFNPYTNTASTTYSPATAIPINKPGQDTYIRVLRIPPGQQAPPGAISADDVIATIGPRIKG